MSEYIPGEEPKHPVEDELRYMLLRPSTQEITSIYNALLIHLGDVPPERMVALVLVAIAKWYEIREFEGETDDDAA